jgi:hypothetical protein
MRCLTRIRIDFQATCSECDSRRNGFGAIGAIANGAEPLDHLSRGAKPGHLWLREPLLSGLPPGVGPALCGPPRRWFVHGRNCARMHCLPWDGAVDVRRKTCATTQGRDTTHGACGGCALRAEACAVICISVDRYSTGGVSRMRRGSGCETLLECRPSVTFWVEVCRSARLVLHHAPAVSCGRVMSHLR